VVGGLVVAELVAQPATARLKPRKDAAATAKTRSVRTTANRRYPTTRGAVFTALKNMRTP